MDGLGHAIWAAKAERKFRPQIIVDKTAIENANKEISELKRKGVIKDTSSTVEV